MKGKAPYEFAAHDSQLISIQDYGHLSSRDLHAVPGKHVSVSDDMLRTASDNNMKKYFCATFRTFMSCVGLGFLGQSILRNGTIDDLHSHKTKVRPNVKLFITDHVSWPGVERLKQFDVTHWLTSIT